MKDREETALRLSDGYPGFTREETLDKLKEPKFPPTCRMFDTARPGICPSCKAWGRITSPIALYKYEIVHTPEHKRAIGDEIVQFRTAYASNRDPGKALAEVEHALRDLKARDPELARDCAPRLMALIVKWGWPGGGGENRRRRGRARRSPRRALGAQAQARQRRREPKENAPRSAVGWGAKEHVTAS